MVTLFGLVAWLTLLRLRDGEWSWIADEPGVASPEQVAAWEEAMDRLRIGGRITGVSWGTDEHGDAALDLRLETGGMVEITARQGMDNGHLTATFFPNAPEFEEDG